MPGQNTALQNFCLLEQEAPSVLFGCKRFHQFVYGYHFDVQKSITKAPPHIQHFMLAIQRYIFDLKFIPRKDAVIPDALPGAYLDDYELEISKEDPRAYVRLSQKCHKGTLMK